MNAPDDWSPIDQDFLRAIRARPGDDTPRLIYADWLSEQGQDARAEFITVDCVLAQLAELDPAFDRLEDRRYELLLAHESKWLGGLRRCTEWFFRRGFVDEVQLRLERPLPRSLLRQAVRAWSISDHLPEAGQERTGLLAGLARRFQSAGRHGILPEELDLSSLTTDPLPALQPTLEAWAHPLARKLSLAHSGYDRQLADLLDHAGLLSTLKHLNPGPFIRDGDNSHRGVDLSALFHRLRHGPLQELVLSHLQLNQDHLAELLQQPPPMLRELDLSYNSIAPYAYQEFLHDVGCQLQRLNLSGTPLAVFRLREILRAPLTKSLRHLHLESTGSARPNLEAILGSPFWEQAESISLRNGTVPPVALEPLVSDVGPPALQRLDLGRNYLGTAGCRLLAQAPWARQVTWLALDHNGIDDDAADYLAEGFPNLRTLHIQGNNWSTAVEDQVVMAGFLRTLTRKRALPRLRLLNLGGNLIGLDGVQAIVEAEHWRLSGLGLGGCPLSPAAVEALAHWPGLARLEWLDLSKMPLLQGQALAPLATSPYLSRLCELSIHGCGASPAIQKQLLGRLGPRLS